MLLHYQSVASGPHLYITGGVPGSVESRTGIKHHKLGLGGTSETVVETSGSTGSFSNSTGSLCNGAASNNNGNIDNTSACDVATFSIGGQQLQANEWYILHTDLNTADGVCTWENGQQLNFSQTDVTLDGTLLQADFDGRLIEAITIVNCQPNYYHFSLIGPYLCNGNQDGNSGYGFDNSAGCSIGAPANMSDLVSSQSPHTYNTLLNLEPPQP